MKMRIDRVAAGCCWAEPCAVRPAENQPVFSAQKAKILFHEGASPFQAMQPSTRRVTRGPTSAHSSAYCHAVLCAEFTPDNSQTLHLVVDATTFPSYTEYRALSPDMRRHSCPQFVMHLMTLSRQLMIDHARSGEERLEQRRHAHDAPLRASESCLPKGGAAQLSFVPSPDGTTSQRHAGQAHEYPQMPMGASSSELAGACLLPLSVALALRLLSCLLGSAKSYAV